MIQKYLFSAFFFLISLTVLAQNTATVKGFVKDENGKPIELLSVVILENQKLATSTNEKGYFELQVPAEQKITLVFSSLSIETQRKTLTLKKDEVQSFNITSKSKTFEFNQVEIKDQSVRQQASVSEIKVKDILLPDAGGGGIEAYLTAQALGLNKSNELSSNYSVRGGNFDENLVYVNDFEVYRPFLIRSGQQEGLSFANPNLVSNIKFSSGGFQSKYGDKLSSVLDVTYKRPKSWGGSVSGSLLGFAGNLEGCSKNKRFTFLIGFRQKTSQYLIKSLETKGQYSPNFIDAQLYANYLINEKWSIELISNYARNKFDFVPDSRTTKFGSVQDVKQLEMAFEGSESDKYTSIMNGLALTFSPKENLKLKLLGSVYNNREKESFDILADYRLGDVETDQSKSNFGDVVSYRGIGGLQNWGRNTLSTDIYLAGLKGSWIKNGHQLQWGVDYKHEQLSDRISEWDRLDSSGHSLPYTVAGKAFYGDSLPVNSDPTVNVNRLLKSQFALTTNRFSAFIQDTWRFGDSARFSLNYGVRFQISDVNKEPCFSPRVQFSVKPVLKKDFIFTLAAGLYYQPPFYREMRDLNGNVNTSLKAQKSAHVVAGLNYAFKAWKRPFSFVTEVYYKYLWDIVPYEFDNALIRYYGQNMGKGYATGIDMRLNGELAEGAESWISMSVMGTFNDIGGTVTHYYDSAHNEIKVRNEKTKIVDSSTSNIGYQPRPADQRVMFNMFFTDYIPKFPYIRLNLNLIFGSGLPYKAPNAVAYDTKNRMPFYRRVDLGFAFQLWNPKWAKKHTKVGDGIKSVWLSLDVLNVFGISNTVSYLFVKDLYSNQYAVPNYLTTRRINAKLVINF